MSPSLAIEYTEDWNGVSPLHLIKLSAAVGKTVVDELPPVVAPTDLTALMNPTSSSAAGTMLRAVAAMGPLGAPNAP